LLDTHRPGGNSIHLWDAVTGNEVFRSPPSKARHMAIAFSHDGKTLVSTDWDNSDGVICGLDVWEATTGRHLHRMTLKDYRADCLALSSDGVTAAVGGASDPSRGLIRLWDLQKGTEILALPVYQHVITSLAFSPDGKRLVSGGSDRTLRLWEVATGKEIFARKEQQLTITAVAFSPDGDLVASGTGADRPLFPEQVRLWDVESGQEIDHLSTNSSSVTSLAFSRDGSRLASGLRNSSVLIWDVAARKGQPREVRQLDRKELESLWGDLAGEDAYKAHRAIWALDTAGPHVVSFLKERLQPVPEPDSDAIKRLIADLDHEKFAVRQQAALRLRQLGERAVPLLREALAQRPPLEARLRLEELLSRAEAPPTSGEQIRALRAVESLERIGTADARQVLQRLAGGMTTARLTRAACASLDRLAQRPTPKK
jgi:sugar lactone lactonase YvrE